MGLIADLPFLPLTFCYMSSWVDATFSLAFGDEEVSHGCSVLEEANVIVAVTAA